MPDSLMHLDDALAGKALLSVLASVA